MLVWDTYANIFFNANEKQVRQLNEDFKRRLHEDKILFVKDQRHFILDLPNKD